MQPISSQEAARPRWLPGVLIGLCAAQPLLDVLSFWTQTAWPRHEHFACAADAFAGGCRGAGVRALGPQARLSDPVRRARRVLGRTYACLPPRGLCRPGLRPDKLYPRCAAAGLYLQPDHALSAHAALSGRARGRVHDQPVPDRGGHARVRPDRDVHAHVCEVSHRLVRLVLAAQFAERHPRRAHRDRHACGRAPREAARRRDALYRRLCAAVFCLARGWPMPRSSASPPACA